MSRIMTMTNALLVLFASKMVRSNPFEARRHRYRGTQLTERRTHLEYYMIVARVRKTGFKALELNPCLTKRIDKQREKTACLTGSLENPNRGSSWKISVL